MAKFVFVTGGVVSGLGKGITAASLGRLLKARGYKVTLQKFDPYINIDPGNISPYQHGEVYVTEDGAETDLDLGHYERFIDENLCIHNDITTGQIYSSVISKERQGYYNGGTVQVIPHITNEIKDKIYRVAKETNTDIVITEIGGTVGDIESHPFLEAIRQVPSDVGRGNVVYIHVTLVPYIKMSGEQKTKPTQHSVKELQNVGIQPDLIVCRSDYALGNESKDKLSLFCNVDKDCVIQNLDAVNLFEVPLLLEKEGLAKAVCRKLSLDNPEPDLRDWKTLSDKVKELSKAKKSIKIGLVGKYVEMYDAYLSLVEALKHGGIANNRGVEIDWISSETLNEKNLDEKLAKVDGIVLPAGFGIRGWEGKILVSKWAREHNMPILGIGMGMQASVVEFARNICGLNDANSTEHDPDTKYPVVHKANTDEDCFRLGAFPTKLSENTMARSIYGDEVIYERHRHKYEINNEFRQLFVDKGMVISGISAEGKYIEIIEFPKQKFNVSVIFHPEFKSRPTRPHQLFTAFIKACKND